MKTEKTIEMLKLKRKTLLVRRSEKSLTDKNEKNRIDVCLATVTSQLYQLTKNPIYRVNNSIRINKRNRDID